MKTKRQPKHKELVRLIQYTIAGGAWFWSGYAMFALCDQVFGLSLWWAKLIANIFGITVNFILERIWVFDDKKRKVKKLTVVTERYIIITLANFVIDYLIIRILKDSFGISPYIGQFVAAGFFWMWNYVWYRYWVFATNKKTRKAHA